MIVGVFIFEMFLVEGEMICFLKSKRKLKKRKIRRRWSIGINKFFDFKDLIDNFVFKLFYILGEFGFFIVNEILDFYYLFVNFWIDIFKGSNMLVFFGSDIILIGVCFIY